MRVLTALLVIPTLALLAIACSGDDDEEATPTVAASIAAATEAPAESPSPEATGTDAPEATGTPEASDTPEATATPFPGGTDPVLFDSEPAQPPAIFVLEDVRVGEHPEDGGFDRIVFEFDDEDDNAHPGGSVEYVEEAFQCGSGEPVEVAGEAILAVRFDFTQAHDDEGDLTVDALDIAGPGTAILQAVSYCDFEGVVQWALGLPSELDFNVTFLSDDPRIVVDVRWP